MSKKDPKMAEPSKATKYDATALYGGALVCDLPSHFIDVSKMREVPDSQECFLNRDGYTSIIFDILQRVGAPGTGPEVDGPALFTHIKDIVGDEDGENLTVWNTSPTKFSRLSEDIPAYTLIATTTHEQTHQSSRPDPSAPSSSTAPGQPKELVFTALILTLLRLEKQNTDIVITINVPHIRGEYDEEDVDMELGRQGELIGVAVEYAARLWETFNVKDWGLFDRAP